VVPRAAGAVQLVQRSARRQRGGVGGVRRDGGGVGPERQQLHQHRPRARTQRRRLFAHAHHRPQLLAHLADARIPGQENGHQDHAQ